MKNTFLVICLLSSFISFGQNFTFKWDKNQMTFEEVVEVAGTDKNELYNRAVEYMATTFKKNYEPYLNDREAGKFFFSTAIEYDRPPGFMIGKDKVVVFFKCEMHFKDGRYKYIIQDISLRRTIGNVLRTNKDLIENWQFDDLYHNQIDPSHKVGIRKKYRDEYLKSMYRIIDLFEFGLKKGVEKPMQDF
ncbi:MAG: DUF4468 domain-containing protein [Chitinophagaceae bacterium]|nr:DUF4468 domain-containing protein [Chitinophagaceae bacterium]